MVDLTVVVAGDEDDGTSSLAGWLLDEDELRGCVRVLPGPPAPGVLGSPLHELVVAVSSGGGATALASVAIAWLKRRVGSVRLKISRPDGACVELSAEHVRALDEDGLRAQVAQLVAAMSPPARDVSDEGPASGRA